MRLVVEAMATVEAMMATMEAIRAVAITVPVAAVSAPIEAKARTVVTHPPTMAMSTVPPATLVRDFLRRALASFGSSTL